MATGKFLNYDITPEGKTKKIRPEKILNGFFLLQYALCNTL